ncbi:redox-regulated ATPase YchF [Candidatus Uhrbacteria bacterium]|nr:MAG: redox-regulated ATPase YchF [Candidatus Uhrbacteria bacterium]
MALQIGIVGLPNVGKSTLFSAITKKQVDCANYPFCTIDPNVGVVEVPDERLAVLAKISNTQKIVPTVIEFVDIAGLVKGAAEGQGLGNKFLSNIRETDAIAQVVRAFEDTNILHVDGSIDPLRDAETINTELALADLEQLVKRKDNIEKQMKSGKTKELEAELAAVTRAVDALNAGIMLRDVPWPEEERKALKQLNPLTLKPMLYVVNVSEAQLGDGSWKERVKDLKGRLVPVCVKMEADLSTMSDEEKKEYLEMAGQTRSGLDELIKQAYDVLGLITFLTTGEIETRAWTVTKGSTAPQAAGKIHTDFEKNFIRAEVTSYDDYVACGGEAGARDKGKTRVEGKEYVMRDGDVCYFRIGA